MKTFATAMDGETFKTHTVWEKYVRKGQVARGKRGSEASSQAHKLC